SLVIAAVTTCPPMSMRTWAVVVPFLTSTIRPLSWLRALIFMGLLLLRQIRCSKAVLGEYFLSFGGEDEQSEAVRGGRRVIHHRKSVIGANRQRVRQRHDL